MNIKKNNDLNISFYNGVNIMTALLIALAEKYIKCSVYPEINNLGTITITVRKSKFCIDGMDWLTLKEKIDDIQKRDYNNKFPCIQCKSDANVQCEVCSVWQCMKCYIKSFADGMGIITCSECGRKIGQTLKWCQVMDGIAELEHKAQAINI